MFINFIINWFKFRGLNSKGRIVTLNNDELVKKIKPMANQK